MFDIRKHLISCATFQALSHPEVDNLAEDCDVLTVGRGTSVYRESDTLSDVYLLAEGRVQVSHIDESGKQSILMLITPGKLFGELAICLSGTREERGEATAESEIVIIPADRLRKLLPGNAELSFAFLSLFSVRRQSMERRLKGVMFRSTRQRLISLLHELAEFDSRFHSEELRVPMISHQDLASMIGVARETVTITLGLLRAEGLIRVECRQIVICQRDRQWQAAVPPSQQNGKSE